MIPARRFGKPIPLPSTRQIRHELIVMWEADALRRETRRADTAAIGGAAGAQLPAPAPV